MSSTVIAFNSPEATLEHVGGKGANLAELVRAGFAVPPGFFISTQAYHAFVLENKLGATIITLVQATPADDPIALEQVSAQIRSLFEGAHMPQELAQQIVSAYMQLGPGSELAVAVRSSATAEDLPGMSFAGQQDTYLNIMGEQAVLDAVKRCWASLWTARAIGYRARNAIAPDNVALAVVVQQLVASDVSGVLFTANPLTGRRAEIVIDASYGLGEAIVSGQVEPDHYVVDPQTWRITSCKLGAKALTIVPLPGGGTRELGPVFGDQGSDKHIQQEEAQNSEIQISGRVWSQTMDHPQTNTQALSNAQILELARTSQRIAEHYGEPQDIEWAFANDKLSILQARPITSLYPLPDSTLSQYGRRIFWSFASVQGVLDPLTPLGRDVIRQIMAPGLFRLLKLDTRASEVLLEAGDRLYLDITGATVVFNAILANGDPPSSQILTKLIADGTIALNAPFSPAERRRLLPKLVLIISRIVRTLHAPDFQRAHAIIRAEARIEEARLSAQKAASLNAILDGLESMLPRFIQQELPNIVPIIAPGYSLMKLIDGWLVAWLDMQPGAVFQLLRGLPGNVTSEMDLNLWAAVQSIRADIASRESMLGQSLDALVQAYTSRSLPPIAQQAIEDFAQRYGMRAVGEIDFGRKRWREDMTPILQTMRNYLEQSNPDLAPDLIFARGAAEAERLAAEWTQQLSQKPYGRPRAAILSFAINRMRKLIGFRESPKFYIIQLFGIFRAALLEHANLMVQRGALSQPDDLFFLRLDELRRYAAGEQIDLRARVAAARHANQREQSRRRIPRLMLSTGETFYEGIGVENDSDLSGDPVSPGVVEGRARVVLNPHGVRLEPGEILVCPATDPGWTPLFLTAGGLVMEIGGMITHGSVVAREYGIPAVVGVPGATTRIQSGQMLRVDGTSGRVAILEQELRAEMDA